MPAKPSLLSRARRFAPLAHIAAGIMGGLALVVFAVLLWRTKWAGHSDFDQLYLAGTAWRRGIPPYGRTPAFQVPDGPSSATLQVYYYLPFCSLLAAPLSLLPFPLADLLWRFGVFTLLLAGVWRFSRRVLPDWPVSLRLLALGLTAISGSLRWNLALHQPTALAVALALWFACALIEGRLGTAVALGVLISFKPTYLLPVVGLLLLQRHYRALCILAGAVVVLNVAALLPTGPVATVRAYRETMRHFEDPGSTNYPSALDVLTPYLRSDSASPLARFAPCHRGPEQWATDQLHARFLFSAWVRTLALAKTLGLLFDVGFLLYLGLVLRRAQKTRLARDPSFVLLWCSALMAFSLLMVYHQRYDLLALCPLVFVSLATLRRNDNKGAARLTLVVSFVATYPLTFRMVQFWHSRVVLPSGQLFLVPILSYLVLAALFGSLRMLVYRIGEEEKKQEAASRQVYDSTGPNRAEKIGGRV